MLINFISIAFRLKSYISIFEDMQCIQTMALYASCLYLSLNHKILQQKLWFYLNTLMTEKIKFLTIC